MKRRKLSSPGSGAMPSPPESGRPKKHLKTESVEGSEVLTDDSSLPSPLPSTGERYLPSMNGIIEIEHLHRYAAAVRVVHGRDVLDIASGEGYGSHLLAQSAKSVIGVDISADAVTFSRSKYGNMANLRYETGDCANIPLPDSSVDVIVSFETIEHHSAHNEMIAEFARVLRPDGFVMISSPNKATYSDDANYQNPYHIKELYKHEFFDLLGTKFKYISKYGQAIMSGSMIKIIDSVISYTEIRSGSGQEVFPENSDFFFNPLYFIALCSNKKTSIPKLKNGLFVHHERDIFSEMLRKSEKNSSSLQSDDREHLPEFLKSDPEIIEGGVNAALQRLGFTSATSGLIKGTLELTKDGHEWRGWACRADSGAPAKFIVVGDNRTAIIVRPTLPRPDIAVIQATASAWLSGFSIPVDLLGDVSIEEICAIAVEPEVGAFHLAILIL